MVNQLVTRWQATQLQQLLLVSYIHPDLWEQYFAPVYAECELWKGHINLILVSDRRQKAWG